SSQYTNRPATTGRCCAPVATATGSPSASQQHGRCPETSSRVAYTFASPLRVSSHAKRPLAVRAWSWLPVAVDSATPSAGQPAVRVPSSFKLCAKRSFAFPGPAFRASLHTIDNPNVDTSSRWSTVGDEVTTIPESGHAGSGSPLASSLRATMLLPPPNRAPDSSQTTKKELERALRRGFALSSERPSSANPPD